MYFDLDSSIVAYIRLPFGMDLHDYNATPDSNDYNVTWIFRFRRTHFVGKKILANHNNSIFVLYLTLYTGEYGTVLLCAGEDTLTPPSSTHFMPHPISKT